MIPKKVNMGIPSKEYITIENLNDKYDSYEYSIMAATSSNAKAKQNGRDRQLQRAMKKSFSSSNSDEYTMEEKWKLDKRNTCVVQKEKNCCKRLEICNIKL